MSDLMRIESRSNPRIKEYRRLKDKKERMETGKYLVEGFRLVEEAFRAGMAIEAILYDEDEDKGFETYIRPYLKDETVIVATKEILKDLSSTQAPQGVVAVVTISSEPEERPGLVLYLDRIQDPGNLGTILRSAHAGGASRILVSKGTVDPYSEKAIRSSMGSIFHVAVSMNGEEELEAYLGKGYRLAITSLDAEHSLYKEDLTGNLIIAIGNEGSGVSEELIAMSDLHLKIPMPGNAESLNAAVAASIIIFERVRQLEELKR